MAAAALPLTNGEPTTMPRREFQYDDCDARARVDQRLNQTDELAFQLRRRLKWSGSRG